MEDKLDEYLRDANKQSKRSRRKPQAQRSRKNVRESALKRWASAAAMDLFKLYVPLMALAVAGFFMWVAKISFAQYCWLAFAVVTLIGLAYCAIDFYRFLNWTTKLTYNVEGWTHVVNSRTPSFWDMSGEYWLPVKIVVVMRDPVNAKHHAVVEAFLKKLRRRLNQWTVSKEQHFGYSQPTGWTHDGLIMTGDLNPRVLNLIRKKLSGELNGLCKLMPGSIDKVVIAPMGSEKYHKTYVDPSSD
jgi:hypothetical protein